MMRAPSLDRLGDLRAHAVEGGSQPGAAVGDPVEPGQHLGLQAGIGAVVVDVDDLGQLVVVDDRERQGQLAAATPGPASSRLASGPTDDDTAVTTSSRMASSGGLVTWANSCLK